MKQIKDNNYIEGLFSKVAAKYDFLNHLLSLNMDKKWRRKLVRQAGLKPGLRILDVCTGTGDIAIEFLKRNPSSEIVGIDLTEKMLDIARKKVSAMGFHGKIKLETGDCLDLPFDDQTFDIVTIGFGLRNLSHYEKGLAEIVRVLKKEGQLLVLEFSMPQNFLFSRIYRFYLNRIIPFIGGIVSRFDPAYNYLSFSIQDFFNKQDVLELMRKSGLEKTCLFPLTGGVVTIYHGEKKNKYCNYSGR